MAWNSHTKDNVFEYPGSKNEKSLILEIISWIPKLNHKIKILDGNKDSPCRVKPLRDDE